MLSVILPAPGKAANKIFFCLFFVLREYFLHHFSTFSANPTANQRKKTLTTHTAVLASYLLCAELCAVHLQLRRRWLFWPLEVEFHHADVIFPVRGRLGCVSF